MKEDKIQDRLEAMLSIVVIIGLLVGVSLGIYLSSTDDVKTISLEGLQEINSIFERHSRGEIELSQDGLERLIEEFNLPFSGK